MSQYLYDSYRHETMIVRCRSYQTRLLQEISNTSITLTDPSLNLNQRIESCLDHIRSLLNYFERRFVKGYRMNCTAENERRRFVELMLNSIENSDYITLLNELPQEQNATKIMQQKYEIIRLRMMNLNRLHV